jgi:hypothetical protein
MEKAEAEKEEQKKLMRGVRQVTLNDHVVIVKNNFCTRCHTVRDAEYFALDASQPNGLSPICEHCQIKETIRR